MSLKILNVGFGNVVLVSKIVGIIHAESSSGKRLRLEAKERGTLVDATQGKKTRSIVITDSHLVLSNLSPESLTNRIVRSDNSIDREEEGKDS